MTERRIELVMSEKAFNILKRDCTIDSLIASGEPKGPVDYAMSKIITAVGAGEGSVCLKAKGDV